MFVDAFVHPIFRLLIAAVVEIAVGLDEVDIFVDHIPYLLDTIAVETTVAQHLRQPAALGLGEEVEGVAEIGSGHVAFINILAITLVDDNAVADLHDASLDALKLVARASQLDEQKEVDHRMTGGLALSDTYGLDEYLVEACSLAEDDGLTRLAGHTAQRTCRRTRTNE